MKLSSYYSILDHEYQLKCESRAYLEAATPALATSDGRHGQALRPPPLEGRQPVGERTHGAGTPGQRLQQHHNV